MQSNIIRPEDVEQEAGKYGEGGWGRRTGRSSCSLNSSKKKMNRIDCIPWPDSSSTFGLIMTLGVPHRQY